VSTPCRTGIPLKTRYTDEDLGSLPERIQAETWQRYQLVLEVYQYYQTDTLHMLSRQQITDYVQTHSASTEQAVRSVSSIERYMKGFVASGGDIAAGSNTSARGAKGKSGWIARRNNPQHHPRKIRPCCNASHR
jgi:hypothetical protein